jgi:polysaccharide export outer membrane protein
MQTPFAKNKTSVTGTLVVALLSCSIALAQAPANPAKPAQTETKPPTTMKPIGEPEAGAVAAPVDPKTYLIGPEDVVGIKVWREGDLSGSVAVRPDGYITLPLVGEMKAGGTTPMQLQTMVTEAYTKYLNRPEVTVSILEVRSKRYYIVGNAGHTGPFPLVTPTTVLQALAESGGFKEFAKTSKIVIMRGDQRLKFNYKEVIKGKNMEQNIFLQNEDHIIVP